MNKQLTFAQYRAMDLGILAMLLAVFEFVIIRVAQADAFSDQVFTVSLAAPITAIVYMRWGVYGGLHAALAGFLFCLYGGGTPTQYLIYIVGNLFSLPMALLRNRVGAERIRTGFWASHLFGLGVLLSMQFGRAVMSLLTGASLSAATGFFSTDALSGLFTVVIIWIVRRLDGVYEDQKHYLLRIQKEDAGNTQ